MTTELTYLFRRNNLPSPDQFTEESLQATKQELQDSIKVIEFQLESRTEPFGDQTEAEFEIWKLKARRALEYKVKQVEALKVLQEALSSKETPIEKETSVEPDLENKVTIRNSRPVYKAKVLGSLQEDLDNSLNLLGSCIDLLNKIITEENLFLPPNEVKLMTDASVFLALKSK